MSCIWYVCDKGINTSISHLVAEFPDEVADTQPRHELFEVLAGRQLKFAENDRIRLHLENPQRSGSYSIYRGSVW